MHYEIVTHQHSQFPSFKAVGGDPYHNRRPKPDFTLGKELPQKRMLEKQYPQKRDLGTPFNPKFRL